MGRPEVDIFKTRIIVWVPLPRCHMRNGIWKVIIPISQFWFPTSRSYPTPHFQFLTWHLRSGTQTRIPVFKMSASVRPFLPSVPFPVWHPSYPLCRKIILSTHISNSSVILGRRRRYRWTGRTLLVMRTTQILGDSRKQCPKVTFMIRILQLVCM